MEIDLEALERGSASRRTVRPFVDEFTQKDGRRIYVLGEGRLINLAAAEGHPASVMDMSFANQALSVEHLIREKGRLENRVYRVPIAHRSGDRPAQARLHGRADRRAHSAAAGIPGVLDSRDLGRVPLAAPDAGAR